MKMCIFGANGQTGIYILKRGIAQGHAIRAAVRRKESIAAYEDSVEVAEYSFDNLDSVRNALTDCAVVISAIGSGNATAVESTSLYSSSVKTLLKAMELENINRLIVISSAGVDYDPKAPWFYRIIVRRWIMNTYMDMMKMETILEEASKEIRWTIVRPNFLQNGDSKDYLIKNKKVEGGNYKINRVDVADFILRESKENEWIHRHPALSYE